MMPPNAAELAAFRAERETEGWALSGPCIIYAEVEEGQVIGTCMSSIANPLISTGGSLYLLGYFKDPALALWANERLLEIETNDFASLQTECLEATG